MVTLSEAKAHLKVDNDDENALIQTYIDGAEDFIRRYCGQDFEDSLPPVVKVACLQIVGGMYEVRQSEIMSDRQTKGFTVSTLTYTYLDQHRVNRGIT